MKNALQRKGSDNEVLATCIRKPFIFIGLALFYYFLFLLYFGCHGCQREKNPVSKGFSVTLPDNQPNNWLGNRLTTSPIFYFNHSFGNSICFISASVSS